MPTRRSIVGNAALILTALAVCGADAYGQSLGEALEDSKFTIDWRLRYEGVDQTGIPEDARALTSRLRAGVHTSQWADTSLLAELVWSEDLVDDFNSTTNGHTEFPVVADPGGFTAVNRFAFVNRSIGNTVLTVGRQRIVLDDSRFVGNVGWRQNEQTYDGVRAEIDVGADAGVHMDLAFVDQVNRIFGPDSPAGKWNGDILLANASKDFSWGEVTGFGYGVDIEEAPALSSSTFGLRVSGSRPFERLTALYTVSAARQTDAGGNPVSFSELYLMAEGGIRLGKLTLVAGLEELGSNGTTSVTTPLATLHAFQGWADKFLSTPAAGIHDTYARLAYQAGGVGPFEALSIVGVYHVIDAEFGSAHYGDEIDISVVAALRNLRFTLKYAAFEAKDLFTDTDKLWASLDYSF